MLYNAPRTKQRAVRNARYEATRDDSSRNSYSEADFTPGLEESQVVDVVEHGSQTHVVLYHDRRVLDVAVATVRPQFVLHAHGLNENVRKVVYAEFRLVGTFMRHQRVRCECNPRDVFTPRVPRLGEVNRAAFIPEGSHTFTATVTANNTNLPINRTSISVQSTSLTVNYGPSLPHKNLSYKKLIFTARHGKVYFVLSKSATFLLEKVDYIRGPTTGLKEWEIS